MAQEIFISYSRRDFNKVKPIKDEIDRELGIDCWMDLDGIESGEQFESKIITAIKDHDTMLFMLSANSMNSIYALKELKFAQLKKKRVIIVYIASCEMTDEFLFNYSMYDTIEWENPLQHDKLIKNLRQWFNGLKQPEATISPTYPEELFQLGKKLIKQSYCHGDGNPEDDKEAVRLFKKAAELGHTVAQYYLGFCYKYGYGVSRDYTESAKWLIISAEHGCSKAQYELGYSYEWGRGVVKDKNKAIQWYIKAAKQGDKGAISWLELSHITY